VAGYVLIVESDPELQRRIGDALREGRYELASEAEAKWAQRSIAVRAPDAVIVDTQLSDGDGFRLAEELRRDPDTRDAPIFFIASSHRGARSSSVSTNGTPHWPFHASTLWSRLSTLRGLGISSSAATS